jgi:hypothetical protein
MSDELQFVEFDPDGDKLKFVGHFGTFAQPARGLG